MPYLGKSPSAGVRQRYQYTATAGQTTFSGTDTANLTLTYTDNNFVDVFQNGVLLKGGTTDYTATSGTSVVLTTGASVSDVIEIIVYDVFSVGNFYNRTDSDSRYLNVAGDTMTGSLDLNGTELVLDVDGDTSITSDTDDQIDIKIAGADDFAFKANTFEVQTGSNIDMNGTELILDADGDTSITADTDDKIDIKVGGTDSVIIDSSGRVTVGQVGSDTTISGGQPAFQVTGAAFDGYAAIVRRDNGQYGSGIVLAKSRNTTADSFTIVQSGDALGSIVFIGDDGTNLDTYGAVISAEVDGTPGANDLPTRLTFSTTPDGSASPAERMRITESGGLFISCTSEPSNTTSGIFLRDNAEGGCKFSRGNAVSLTTVLEFQNGNGAVGTIKTTGTSTQFNTSSDYRLKENVVTEWDATSRLKQLKPSRFNFKTDADTTLDGFLAHEVSSIVPEAISGEKDAMKNESNVVLNSDGTVYTWGVSKERWEAGKLPTTTIDKDGKEVKINPIYASDTTWVESKSVPDHQAIDQSKLVPLLTKALQESVARADALEARIKKLEDG